VRTADGVPAYAGCDGKLAAGWEHARKMYSGLQDVQVVGGRPRESLARDSPRRMFVTALRRTVMSVPPAGTHSTRSSQTGPRSEPGSIHSVRSFTSDAEAVPLIKVPMEDPAEDAAREAYISATMPLSGAQLLSRARTRAGWFALASLDCLTEACMRWRRWFA
jgi:hypothetical protein